MIGYIEDEYNVLKEFKYEDGDNQHVYQLRQKKDTGFESLYSRFWGNIEEFKKKNPKIYNQTKESYETELRPYISIEINNKPKKEWVDLLLFYPEEDKTNIDWEVISTDKKLKIKDLSFNYRIENHHTGYGKDGMIVMY